MHDDLWVETRGGARERGRRVWRLWPGFCEPGQNPGRTNQIEATLSACAMSHDFRIERVTKLVKHVVSIQEEVSKAVSLAASQLGYM